MSSIKKLIKRAIPRHSLKSVEKAYRFNKAIAANATFGYPAKNMQVVAVTGTNGKTTTCTFINEIFKAAGLKTAVFTTAFLEIDGRNEFNASHMTVPSAWAVQKFMSRAKRAGVDWVILEVTSHALDQYRVHGVPIKVAVVTNLSQEHLDYHGDMQAYASSKARLLTDFKPKAVILNADDQWFDFFKGLVSSKTTTVGKNQADYQIKQLKLTSQGSEFALISPHSALKIQTSLVGEFNAYNAAQAAVVGLEAKISAEDIEKGIAHVPLVPGRMEPVDVGQEFSVLVDYAVTPDALEKALQALGSVTKGSVRVVFGATGDRDKSKRPFMGVAAAKNADFIYLTDDETYTENGDAIRRAVRQGIEQAKAANKFTEIADRREAIKQAFIDAKPGDAVLLTGIGHEDYRNMGGKKEAWDERVVAREILREIGAGK